MRPPERLAQLRLAPEIHDSAGRPLARRLEPRSNPRSAGRKSRSPLSDRQRFGTLQEFTAGWPARLPKVNAASPLPRQTWFLLLSAPASRTWPSVSNRRQEECRSHRTGQVRTSRASCANPNVLGRKRPCGKMHLPSGACASCESRKTGMQTMYLFPQRERDYARTGQVTETARRPGNEEVRAMAVMHQDRTVPTGARTIYLLVRLAERAARRIRRWRLERQAWRCLARMSDRELGDIGLTRRDIDRLPDWF